MALGTRDKHATRGVFVTRSQGHNWPRTPWSLRDLLPFILAICFLAGTLHAAEEPKSDPEGEKFFEAEVLPILKAHCFNCHGGEKKIQANLNLTGRDDVLKGGDSGPAVDLKTPPDSVLLQAINYDGLEMPPKGKLPQAQIDTLTKWVERGLPYSSKASAAVKHGPPQVDDEARRFWSFVPVKRPEVPAVKNAGWVLSPTDAFLLAKLEAAGLTPAADASKTTLLRRAYYDLIGLPPTTEQTAAFLADESPNAFEKVVDELLASPHYGERWGRHWLDLVRYAETNSFERDSAKPNAWKYRDYVIQSFNSDKPYDQFLREQLAGDELDEVTSETIIATGYYRLGQWDDEPADPMQAYFDELDDILATTGQAVLGLTVNCARCHDHKIDPFPQRDYYRLLGFLHGIRRYGPDSQRVIAPEQAREKQSAEVQAHQKQVDEIKQQLTAIEDLVRPHLAGGEKDDFKNEQNKLPILKKHSPAHVSEEKVEEFERLRRRLRRLERERPAALDSALAVFERPAPETFVLIRGSHQAHGEKVVPGFPAVLGNQDATITKPAQGDSSGRRRALAEWLTKPENPLTARVIVNRIWQHHFGRGIVRTSSDFGYRGTPPTHPELLDWLASEFVAGGWKLKPLHKRLVMSHAYRMSSQPNEAALTKDPENDLFWRFNLRRLSAEEIRDSVLAVSGNLNLKTGGPSIYPTIPKEVLAGQSVPGSGWHTSSPEEQTRRSVYVHIKRSLSLPILAAFDSADTDSPCPVRFTTTQPTQALAMINSDFLNEQAGVFAANAQKLAGSEPATQVAKILERVTQRTPNQSEIDRGVKFLARMQSEHQLSPDAALKNFCLLSLNLNEFVYLE